MDAAKLVSVLLFVAATSSPASAQSPALRRPRTLLPDAYAVELVSTAAFGADMNDAGDVIGTSYPDVGCGSFCLPPLETVAWTSSGRLVLPSIAGFSGITVRSINGNGWVAGFAGFPGTATRAVVWIPSGGGYQAIDLGTLPGTNSSEATGVDDQGRVVGWSTTTNFPPNGSPFLWTLAGGMVDLSAQGFPDEMPFAISPGGTVSTVASWYRLGDPGSVTPLAAPPTGYGLNAGSIAINDAGDQGRFLVRVSGQNLRYLYRYRHDGVWQELSPSGTGNLSSYGIGSIDDHRTVTATVQSTGVIARGPDEVAQPLAPLISTAYPESAVVSGGPIVRDGSILARAMIGQSPRLVRLVPSWSCAAQCVRVAELTIDAVFVPDPTDPTQDHCSPTLNAHNEALVTVHVVDSAGAPVAGAVVSGRMLDDYWTEDAVVLTTNANGVASFRYEGLCGVGALAFLVDDVDAPGLVLDRTSGVLTVWEIPQ